MIPVRLCHSSSANVERQKVTAPISSSSSGTTRHHNIVRVDSESATTQRPDALGVLQAIHTTSTQHKLPGSSPSLEDPIVNVQSQTKAVNPRRVASVTARCGVAAVPVSGATSNSTNDDSASRLKKRSGAVPRSALVPSVTVTGIDAACSSSDPPLSAAGSNFDVRKLFQIPCSPSLQLPSIATRPGPSLLPQASPLSIEAQRSQIGAHSHYPSALATARIIEDLGSVSYPEGIRSPKIELNVNAKGGKLRDDPDFLMQFMKVCKDKPDNLPPLDAIGLEPSEQGAGVPMNRGGSQRRFSAAMGSPPPNSSRQLQGLGRSNFGEPGGNFTVGKFATPNIKTSEDRFKESQLGRSASMTGGSAPVGVPFGGGRPSSKGGPGASFGGSSLSQQGNMMLEPVAPLVQSADRWQPQSIGKKPQQVEDDSPEVVDRKVRALLNKLTMERFDSISDQIISWANKSENEQDGRTLIQVIRLVFEKATDEAAWSEMYARLCRKMMKQISPKVQDEYIKNAEGKPIAGGQLFRKYLLNRCQEDFERGWAAKENAIAAAATKASEDQAAKAAADKDESGEAALYSEEYYTAQKAKRQGLSLIKFIGELFKLQMLTERIMHECVKKLLGNVENPEEEEIESLCKLLATVGQQLDTAKARAHMDVVFTRMKELVKNPNVNFRMQFVLLDLLELRERKWVPRNLAAGPTTISALHAQAAKETAAKEKDYQRTMSMSRGGSKRGGERGDHQVGPDGWAVAGNAPPRLPSKAGDLTNFGKISKKNSMTFGPTGVFAKDKDKGKRESTSLSRGSNMFSKLVENPELAVEAAAATSSRPSNRKPSVDLSSAAAPKAPLQRKKLTLLPRTLPKADEARADSTPALSEVEAKTRVAEDSKELFSVRDRDAAEVHFSKLPSGVFAKAKDKGKRESTSLSQDYQCAKNMSRCDEFAAQDVTATSSRPGPQPAYRKPSVHLSLPDANVVPPQHRMLNLLPHTPAESDEACLCTDSASVDSGCPKDEQSGPSPVFEEANTGLEDRLWRRALSATPSLSLSSVSTLSPSPTTSIYFGERLGDVDDPAFGRYLNRAFVDTPSANPMLSSPTVQLHNLNPAAAVYLPPTKNICVDTEQQGIYALLSKLDTESLRSTSDKISAWTVQFGAEHYTSRVRQVIHAVLDAVIQGPTSSELYARLCLTLAVEEQIGHYYGGGSLMNPQDISALEGQFFPAYLFEYLRDSFEYEWAASASFTTPGGALDPGESGYNPGKKRRALSVIKFITQLFKLGLLPEHIVHDCIKKLLANIGKPGVKDDIECLCEVLTSVGFLLDMPENYALMDAYFARIAELRNNTEINLRMLAMLENVIDLRQAAWVPCDLLQSDTSSPIVPAAHDWEGHHVPPIGNMSSDVSQHCLSGDAFPQMVAEVCSPPTFVASHERPKSGDLSEMRNIGESSFMDYKAAYSLHEERTERMSKWCLSTGRLPESTGRPEFTTAKAATGRIGQMSGDGASVDDLCDPAVAAEAPSGCTKQRSPCERLPSKARVVASESAGGNWDRNVLDELPKGDSDEEIKLQISANSKEFFALRDLNKGDAYLRRLPSQHRWRLVSKLISSAVMSGQVADALLVNDLLSSAASQDLFSPDALHAGFSRTLEDLDVVASRTPNAPSLVAIMLKGAKLERERLVRLIRQAVGSDRDILLALLL